MNEATTVQTENFEAFTLVSKSRIPDSNSHYIFENPKGEINALIFSLTNYAGSKRIQIEGSYDNEKWFGLVNDMILSDLNNPNSTQINKIVRFPLASYPYLKIRFNDKKSLPINLLKVGTSVNIIKKTTLDIIESSEVNRLEEGKTNS